MLNLVPEQKKQQKMSLPTAGETEAANRTYFLTENGNSTWKFYFDWVNLLGPYPCSNKTREEEAY